jgi:multidrug efflux pump subunit AcrA (membrane-fusion protein)
VLVKEFRDRVYKATVFGTAHTVDPTTKTMMVEVRVPNPEKQLYSGMGVGVKFSLATPGQVVIVPAAALVTNAEGAQIMVLRPDQTIHVQKVIVGRDFGKELEILDGLDGNETIISNPSDALREGSRVQAAKK